MKIKLLKKEYPLLEITLKVWAVLTGVILLIRYLPELIFWAILN